MLSFWEVFLSPTAVNKFLHTVSSSYVLSALVVIGISSWYLLRNRHVLFAKKSIIIASAFGLVAAVNMIGSGDNSAREVAESQPMKFAAMEALYEGNDKVGLIAAGALGGEEDNEYRQRNFIFKIEIPSALSYMVYLSPEGFIPGIKDLVEGNLERGLLPFEEKTERGAEAIRVLRELNQAKGVDEDRYKELRSKFEDPVWLEEYFQYFGYGYYQGQKAAHTIPNVPLLFYSFHIMVGLGFLFIIFFMVMLFLGMNDKLGKSRWLLHMGVWMIPLAYIASEAGWLVAEMGRQPWVIQDMLPTIAAVSQINASTVQISFWLFAIVFTALFIAELRIMFKQIQIGPKEGGK